VIKSDLPVLSRLSRAEAFHNFSRRHSSVVEHRSSWITMLNIRYGDQIMPDKAPEVLGRLRRILRECLNLSIGCSSREPHVDTELSVLFLIKVRSRAEGEIWRYAAPFALLPQTSPMRIIL
jgi:hypothetical protein